MSVLKARHIRKQQITLAENKRKNRYRWDSEYITPTAMVQQMDIMNKDRTNNKNQLKRSLK